MFFYKAKKHRRSPRILDQQGVASPMPPAGSSNQALMSTIPEVVSRPVTAIQLPLLAEKGRARQVHSERGEKKYDVDLTRYTCTCRSFRTGRTHFGERDIRRACRHISGLLVLEWRAGNVSEFFHALLAHRLNYGRGIWVDVDLHPMFYFQIRGEEVLCVKSDVGGVDVFAPKESPVPAHRAFGYSPNQARWSPLGLPKHHSIITPLIHQWIGAGQPHDFQPLRPRLDG